MLVYFPLLGTVKKWQLGGTQEHCQRRAYRGDGRLPSQFCCVCLSLRAGPLFLPPRHSAPPEHSAGKSGLNFHKHVVTQGEKHLESHILTALTLHKGHWDEASFGGGEEEAVSSQ